MGKQATAARTGKPRTGARATDLMQNPAVAASTRFNQRKQAEPDAAGGVQDRGGPGGTTPHVVAARNRA